MKLLFIIRCIKSNIVGISRGFLPWEFFFFFFIHTLFQLGLMIAPIQNTGLINAKYNNALYGTIIIWYDK